jgi:hypothetical protein
MKTASDNAGPQLRLQPANHAALLSHGQIPPHQSPEHPPIIRPTIRFIGPVA